MTSFRSKTFKELNNDGYTAWPRATVSARKKIPGGPHKVIQKIGTAASTAQIPALMTEAEKDDMLNEVGNSGSLIFLYETVTAKLLEMAPPVSEGVDNDLWTSILTFRRSGAPSGGGIPANARLTEAGDARITESGDYRVIE